MLLLALAGLAGCDALLARRDSYAKVYVDAPLCPEREIAVGERVRMHATVEAKDFGASHVVNTPVSTSTRANRRGAFAGPRADQGCAA